MATGGRPSEAADQYAAMSAAEVNRKMLTKSVGWTIEGILHASGVRVSV